MEILKVDNTLSTYIEVDCEEVLAPPVITPESNDAFLKPRIVFFDGFGVGRIPSIGFGNPVSDVPTHILDLAAYELFPLFNLAVGANWRDINQAFGRVRFTGISHVVEATDGPTIRPFTHIISQNSFDYSQTGGRGVNGGFIKSKSTGQTTFGNSFTVTTKNGADGSPVSFQRSLGIILGLNLVDIPIPATGLPIASFDNNAVSVVDTSADIINIADIDGSYSPSTSNKGIYPAPSALLVINPDYTVSIRAADNTTIIINSIGTVPSNIPFALEASIYTGKAPTGFAYCRLYTPTTGILGVSLFKSSGLNITDVDLGGLSWGSDCRGLTSTIAGYDNLKIDFVVGFDNWGAVRQYLYDLRVGNSWPTGIASQQSTPIGDTTANILAKRLNSMLDLSDYLQFNLNNKDVYSLAAVDPSVADILAARVVSVSDQLNDLIVSVSNRHLGLIISSVEDTKIYDGDGIQGLDFNSIRFLNHVTNLPFTPSDIGAASISHQVTDKSAGFFGTWLEYVYREQKLTLTSAPSVFPVAAFTLVITDGPTNKHIQCSDYSVDYDGTIVNWHWDFGDGNTHDSSVFESLVSHTYTTNGTLVVSLVVTDNDGNVSVPFTQSLVIPNQNPVANFTFANPSGNELDFTDTSNDPDGTIVAWDWDFGDSSSHATTQNPTHVYAAPGTYTITLTVTDNSGGTNSFSASTPVPLVAAGCAMSATTLADTPYAQGEDYNGGNPPLTVYANTAAFDSIYLGFTREIYDSPYDGINDGVSHIIDGTTLFNSHKTLKMAFGKPAATTYQGAGWFTILTNDGDPTETNYTPTVQGIGVWTRLRMKADSGITSAGSGAFNSGLSLVEFQGNLSVGIYNRFGDGRLTVDIAGTAQHSFDLCAETVVIGRGDSDFGELVILAEIDNTAHTLRTRAWAGDACSLAGVSPLLDQSVAIDASPAGKIDSCDHFNNHFTPTGALKYLWVADHEIIPLSVAANPFGVSLT